jgi:hypothetical protein
MATKYWSDGPRTANEFGGAQVVYVTGDRSNLDLRPGNYLIVYRDRGVAEFVKVDEAHRVHVTSKPLPAAIADPEHRAEPNFAFIELAVGQVFRPNGSQPPEGPHILISPGGIMLVLSTPKPNAHHVSTVVDGDVELLLVESASVILFLCRIDRFKFTTPYMASGLRNDATPPRPLAEEGWALTVVLVDAGSGIVRGLRQLTLSGGFSRAVYDARLARRAHATGYEEFMRDARALAALGDEKLASLATARFVLEETAN